MSVSPYEAFLKPTKLKRAIVYGFGYAFYFVVITGLAVGRGMLLGAIQRYALVLVIFFICFAIIYKKSKLTRLVTAVLCECLFGILLCLFIKIFIVFKEKYPGLPIGTLFFFYEKMLSRLFFLLLVQGLKCELMV